MRVVLNAREYNSVADFKFIPAEMVFDCEIDNVDLFLNIASMQEMDSIIIQKYFELINQQRTSKTYFYCCNRVSKMLPDGSFSNFEDYNWRPSDKVGNRIHEDKCATIVDAENKAFDFVYKEKSLWYYLCSFL